MKTIKVLLALAAATFAFASLAGAEEAKKSCCAKAADAGKDCAHGCCVKAKEDGKVCEKCNPPKKADNAT